MGATPGESREKENVMSEQLKVLNAGKITAEAILAGAQRTYSEEEVRRIVREEVAAALDPKRLWEAGFFISPEFIQASRRAGVEILDEDGDVLVRITDAGPIVLALAP